MRLAESLPVWYAAGKQWDKVAATSAVAIHDAQGCRKSDSIKYSILSS
jgi:hypothetical protein